MPLSRIEIRRRAQAFAKEWADTSDEDAEAKSFWDGLDLVRAHHALDKAVGKCCRPQPFGGDAKRVEYLFELYEKYTSGLLAIEKPERKKKA